MRHLATLLAIALAGAGAATAFTPSGLLEIHEINVQQGSSTLIIGPNGTTVLLDAGSAGKGAKIVSYLQSLGLTPADGLDYTILSHMHDDHFGGFAEVVASYDVLVESWNNGSSHSPDGFSGYEIALTGTFAGAPIEAVLDDTVELGVGARLTVVAVDGQVLGYGTVEVSNENDRSLAVLVEYGDFQYLWAGDLGGGGGDNACTGRSTDQANVETPLAQAITPGGGWPLLTAEGVDVLHVNHHGSESSTNSASMNLLRPEVAVIAVGAGQSSNYHHPRQAVVDNVLLAQAPCVSAPAALVLQTEDGTTGEPTSYFGFAVGDVKISTDGTTGYWIDATGDVSRGEDERTDAGLPRSFAFDESGGGGGLLLSEVLYDVTSGDNGFEWVELYNSGTTAVDLSDWSLGNGGPDYTYSTAQLSGTVLPGETFVVGGPASSAVNGYPTFDLVSNFSPDLQNCDTVADGVALFDVPAAQITPSTVPVDAVVYGSTNSNGLIDETGAANAPEVGDADPGESIERCFDLAGSWRIQASPTPNWTPCPPPPPPNTPPAVTITAPADGSSFAAGQPIPFTGTAYDTEDGVLSAGLAWTSSRDGAIGTGASFSTALSAGTHTVTASVTDSGSLAGSDAITVTVQPAMQPAVVLLSEVLYDVPPGDDGWEWVELYNAGTTAVDLSGWSLGNGGNDCTYSLVQLSGTIQPGATFVVGGPSSGSANASPSFDQVLNFTPDFQNSGTVGDVVGLFDVPAASVTAVSVPVDAVIYGPNNSNGLIDETGSANPPEVGDADPGESIERVDLAGTWRIQAGPTPNSTPFVFRDGFESGDTSAWSTVRP